MRQPSDLSIELDSSLSLLLSDSKLDLLVVSDVGDLNSSAEGSEDSVFRAINLLSESRDLLLDGGEGSLFLEKKESRR